MRKSAEYLGIELWGRNIASYWKYIRDQQRKAELDGAPIDAVYYDVTNKKWKTIRDLDPQHPVVGQYNAQKGAK